MSKLLGLALGLALLFGCAAANPDRNSAQVAENGQACKTTDSASLRTEMEASGVKVVADLEGEPFDALVKWITPYTTKKPVPANAARAIIFLNSEKTLAMITWFDAGNCLLAYNMGPWRPLSEFLGTPI
jgi:hypothetical protein